MDEGDCSSSSFSNSNSLTEIGFSCCFSSSLGPASLGSVSVSVDSWPTSGKFFLPNSISTRISPSPPELPFQHGNVSAVNSLSHQLDPLLLQGVLVVDKVVVVVQGCGEEA
uniref:Uncharacterized protein n=1 Tax=Rhizophora mucronata TaxID=61149 RepID=A0A2P2PBH2_RHIMU